MTVAASFTAYIILHLLLELIYFRIATKYKIVDRPNSRSSHNYLTIRGGGIIFPFAFLIAGLSVNSADTLYFSAALIVLAAVSFADDLKGVNSKIRILVQAATVALALWQQLPDPALLALGLIFAVGWINISNFMDGINGITALYFIAAFGSLCWIDHQIVPFADERYFISILAALTIFSFFNLRIRARCFSGDVGSVSIAFIFIFLLTILCRTTGELIWLALGAVYLIDGLFTMFCRLIRRENLLEAHRSHFYQFLANEKKIKHLGVSAIYALIQLIINAIVIIYHQNAPQTVLQSLLVLFLIYFTFRIRLEGLERLFNKY